VQVAGQWQPQGALQRDLARRVVGQVLAAHDVGDALLGVVHHHGQLVGPKAVGALEDEVAHLRAEVLRLGAEAAVLPVDAAVHPEAPGAHRAAVRAVPASAGVDQLAVPLAWASSAGDLATRAGTAVGLAGVDQAPQGGFVVAAAAGLPDWRCVGPQAELAQLLQDQRVHARWAARGVHVLDAHQPPAAMGARIEPAGQRRHQRARVQRAGG
jgi:hypothetical protein